MLLFAVALLGVAVSANIAASTEISRFELTRWSVGPVNPGQPCACPGVRGSRADDSSCVCLNGPSYEVVLPNTLLGGLLRYIPFDPMFGRNLDRISPTPFLKQEWWFNTTAGSCALGETALLELRGVNYRADVYVNGALVANSSRIVGPFRKFALDITEQQQSVNHIAVRLTPAYDNTFPPNSNTTDLSITFVDWSPDPPDRSMGLLEPTVFSCRRVPVALVSVAPNVTLGQGGFNASLALELEYHSLLRGLTADVVVAVSAGASSLFSVSAEVLLNSSKIKLALNAEDYTGLRSIATKHLWYPWQMGQPTMHALTVTVQSQGHSMVLHRGSIAFRQVQSFIDSSGGRQFVVNGNPIQIRGGGWAPDLFLRANDSKLELEFAMVKHMHLNAVRLEGKFMWDGFFELADRMGLMVLPGWCCCDSWQHWPYWGPEQYVVAAGSMRWQLQRLSAQPIGRPVVDHSREVRVGTKGPHVGRLSDGPDLAFLCDLHGGGAVGMLNDHVDALIDHDFGGGGFLAGIEPAVDPDDFHFHIGTD